MLKKRIIGVVVVKQGFAVQSIGFKRHLPIGKPEIAVEFLDSWGIDEIAVIDIDATKNDKIDFEMIGRLSQKCQVPLTYGGGIRTAGQTTKVVQAGADKIMVNQSFLSNPSLVAQAAELLGNQCIVVSLDVILEGTERKVFDYLSGRTTDIPLRDLAKQAEKNGAGEIFLNSVDRDGSKLGYDLEIAEKLTELINIPITLCGGVGEVQHFAEGLKVRNISAVAAGNYFNFTEHSVALTKQKLRAHHAAELRHDTYFSYADSNISPSGRLMKKPDRVLKELLFEYHPREVI